MFVYLWIIQFDKKFWMVHYALNRITGLNCVQLLSLMMILMLEISAYTDELSISSECILTMYQSDHLQENNG